MGNRQRKGERREEGVQVKVGRKENLNEAGLVAF